MEYKIKSVNLVKETILDHGKSNRVYLVEIEVLTYKFLFIPNIKTHSVGYSVNVYHHNNYRYSPSILSDDDEIESYFAKKNYEFADRVELFLLKLKLKGIIGG